MLTPGALDKSCISRHRESEPWDVVVYKHHRPASAASSLPPPLSRISLAFFRKQKKETAKHQDEKTHTHPNYSHPFNTIHLLTLRASRGRAGRGFLPLLHPLPALPRLPPTRHRRYGNPRPSSNPGLRTPPHLLHPLHPLPRRRLGTVIIVARGGRNNNTTRVSLYMCQLYQITEDAYVTVVVQPVGQLAAP